MNPALLDTDILSEVLKRKNPVVVARAKQYLAAFGRLAFSTMTMYEVVKGLTARGATRQLSDFLTVAGTSDTIDVELPILMRAAQLWADAQNGGHPSSDADLIIAATAMESGRTLVTGNTAHFIWIRGLVLEDWRKA